MEIFIGLACLALVGFAAYKLVTRAKARKAPTRFDVTSRDVPTRDDRNPLP